MYKETIESQIKFIETNLQNYQSEQEKVINKMLADTGILQYMNLVDKKIAEYKAQIEILQNIINICEDAEE